jgi:hypothetical protein
MLLEQLEARYYHFLGFGNVVRFKGFILKFKPSEALRRSVQTSRTYGGSESALSGQPIEGLRGRHRVTHQVEVKNTKSL